MKTSGSIKMLLNTVKHTALRSQLRNYATKSKSLIYSNYGEPIKVIQQVDRELEALTDDQVLVKMLAAPVNPADINTIQGKYPEKPALPSIAGNEGVGEILEVGKYVKSLNRGDRVIMAKPGLGTWQTHENFFAHDLIYIPKKLGLIEAATLTVNPCTAYRMIKDFSKLAPGDTVIQNGANSACGQNVIQICKAWGLNTVNVVRDRPDIDELKNYLKGIGGTHVLTEEEIRVTDIFNSELKRPKLALNCVGGKSALEIMRKLDHGGAIVTYGGMSRDPVTIPTSLLIFKNIAAYGFWMTQWNKDYYESNIRKQMFNELIDLMLKNELKGPSHELVKFDQFKTALFNTLSIQGFAGKKFILDFE